MVIQGSRRRRALESPLGHEALGVIGIVLGSQGTAAAAILALAIFSGWLAWALVLSMVIIGLVLVFIAGSAAL
jgi:hypothetical protein